MIYLLILVVCQSVSFFITAIFKNPLRIQSTLNNLLQETELQEKEEVQGEKLKISEEEKSNAR